MLRLIPDADPKLHEKDLAVSRANMATPIRLGLKLDYIQRESSVRYAARYASERNIQLKLVGYRYARFASEHSIKLGIKVHNE